MKSYPLLLLILVLALPSCQNDKENVPEPKIAQEDIAAIDQKVADYLVNYNVPGASLAISKDGKLVYSKGYGMADKSTEEAVTVNHRFRIASISKTITSIAI